MKKLLMICLMAGYGRCFAQNIELRELQRIQEGLSSDQINQLLAPKGYTLPKENSSLIWGFKSDTHPEASDVTQLYRVTDTTGNKLIYETSNPFFYTNLINQLPGNGYQLEQTVAENDKVNLVFCNGRHEILLNVNQTDRTSRPFRITLQPVNKSRTSLSPQYNHKVRVNSY
jgi:hypothetical protein